MANRKIVFFDGDCNFCNATIQFLIRKDTEKQLSFSSLQSEFGQDFLNRRSLQNTNFDTVIYFKEGFAFYTKSDAALHIAKDILPFGWLLYYAFVWIPASFRNIFYDVIARYRKSILKDKSACEIPTEETRKRFIN